MKGNPFTFIHPNFSGRIRALQPRPALNASHCCSRSKHKNTHGRQILTGPSFNPQQMLRLSLLVIMEFLWIKLGSYLEFHIYLEIDISKLQTAILVIGMITRRGRVVNNRPSTI